MQLTNSFRIDRPPAEVFEAFLDIERIATCMPGSRLLGQPAEDTYAGEVKVKVGPLGVAYTGELKLLEANHETMTMTMRAKGREQRGAGNADAHVVAQLTADGSGTVVEIVTDLSIRGKVAQFGRGVIGDVTDGIIAKFAKNVEQMLTAGQSPVGAAASGGAPAGGAPTAAKPTAGATSGGASADWAPAAEAADNDGLDAWSLIVVPMLKKHAGSVVPVVVAAVAGYLGARAGARKGRQRPVPRYYE